MKITQDQIIEAAYKHGADTFEEIDGIRFYTLTSFFRFLEWHKNQHEDKARLDFLQRSFDSALHRENIDKLMATVNELESKTDA